MVGIAVQEDDRQGLAGVQEVGTQRGCWKIHNIIINIHPWQSYPLSLVEV